MIIARNFNLLLDFQIMLQLNQLESQLLQANDDRQKIDLLNEIVFQLRNLDPRRSLELIAEIDALLLQHPDYVEGQMMLRINRAAQSVWRGEFGTVVSQLGDVVSWCRNHQQHRYLVRALEYLGVGYAFSGESTAAALETLLDGLAVAEEFDFRLEKALILGDIGAAHGLTELPERMEPALKATQQALSLYTEVDDVYGMALAQNNLAACYLRLGDIDAAIPLLESSLFNAHQLQNAYLATLPAIQLADMYDQKGDTAKADQYLAESAQIFRQLQNMVEIEAPLVEYYSIAARIYERRRDWQRATDLLMQGLRRAHEDKARHVEYKCHELLAKICEQQGDYATALLHYKQFHAVKEQVFNQENESRFERISKNYQIKQAQLEAEHHKVLSEEGKRHIQRLQSVIGELQSFSHSVAHDLRAPLRSIKGFSQVLAEDYHDHLDTTAQSYLDKIIHATVRMASLIDDIMRLSQITSKEIHITPVNLSATAEAILARLYDSQPTRRVEWKVAPGLMVSGDSGLLEVALDNLLNNAWKYSSKREQALIEFGCEEQGEERIFFVRDNGTGFNMAYQDKLFRAFSRLHRVEEFEGTGIGLATVKRVVERHGGQIWAEGAVDQGATFFFTLHKPLEQ